MSRLEKLLALLAVLPFGIGFTVGGDALPPEKAIFSFADPAIIESSGLVARDGLFATINDSGDSGRVFTVSPDTGDTVAVATWGGEPTDVESIAPLPGGDVLVGDIGDNTESRDAVELLEVPFGADGPVEPTRYELTYPDGPHDAETLLVDPTTGRVLIVDKEIIGRMYAAPAHLDPDGPNRLELRGDDLLPVATDGAFFPDGRHIILRGYFSAAVYDWPSLRQVAEFDLPYQQQGEGIAVDEHGQVFLSSEGQHSDVLALRLPAKVRFALAGPAPQSAGDSPPATPSDNNDAEREGNLANDEHGSTTYWRWGIAAGIGALVVLALVPAVARHRRPR